MTQKPKTDAVAVAQANLEKAKLISNRDDRVEAVQKAGLKLSAVKREAK